MESYYSRFEPIFGSWYLKERIGKGSTGEVYLIEREDMGTTYRSALKCITIPGSDDEIDTIKSNGMTDEEVEKYYQALLDKVSAELNALYALKGNSNIVNYEDHVIIPHEEGLGWDILIRLELLTPLLKYSEEHPLDEDDVARLGRDMCRALKLCGERGLVHRDIKPENIMVSPDGDFKLGDFGVTKIIDETKAGLSMKGTYTYMAPEMFKGEPYGPKSDIYSLGLVMYKFLNGGRNAFMPPPDEGTVYEDSDRAFFRRMSGAKLPPPANGSERLAGIVLKAGSYRPEDRYQSAGEMLTDLENLIHNVPEEKEEKKEKKRGKGILIGIAAVIAAAVIVFVAIPKQVTAVNGIGDEEEIKLGDTLAPEYVIEPDRFADEKITFTSDDEDVFTVDENGVITGTGLGSGTMVIAVKEFERTVDITVVKKVEKITVADSSVSLYVGDSARIKPTLYPKKYADEKVTYESSDEGVAKVSDKGKITAKKKGSCKVTVSAGGSSTTVKVTVNEKPVYQAPVQTNNSVSKKKTTTKKKENSKGYFDSDDDEYF